MPTYSHTQVLGFSVDIQAVLGKERDPLHAAGYDADTGSARIRTLHELVLQLNAHQESLKRQLRETTIAYNEARQALYTECSGTLDTIMAAVGKNSDAAKNLRRLRSRIRKPRGPTQTASVPPQPPAP